MALPLQGETLTSVKGWRMRRPALLYASLLRGSLPTEGKAGIDSWPVALVELGRIHLDTGALVACDPNVSIIVPGGQKPFLRSLPSGHHLVLAAMAQIDGGHRRVAAACLVVGSEQVYRWEIGCCTKEEERSLKADDDLIGYPVDTGIGCFASPSALATAAGVLEHDGGMLRDPLSRAMKESENKAVVASPAPGAAPIAMFQTGWGDGSYPTWFGLDDAGRITVVVTDFLLAGHPDEHAEPAGGEGDKPAGRSWLSRLRGKG